jgi:pimeloyl-ACP methyl ester carboxylesterase
MIEQHDDLERGNSASAQSMSLDIEESKDRDENLTIPNISDISSTPGVDSVIGAADIIPRTNIISQLWNRHVNLSVNEPIRNNLMRMMFFIVVLMGTAIQVPLSYLGITINEGRNDRDDRDDNNESSNIKDETKKPESLKICKGVVGTSLGRIGYILCDGRSNLGYEIEDIKTPIVCIHACRRSSDEFHELLPHLASSNRKVIAIDLFGHGMSETLPSTFFNKNNQILINQVADAACLEVALSIGGMERFIIVANGPSCSVAISIASRYPRRVMGLGLINICSSFTSQNSTFQLKDDGSHFLELHSRVQCLDPDIRLRLVQSEIQYIINERKQQRSTGGGNANNMSSSSSSLESLMGLNNMQEMAKKVDCPTLCIQGDLAIESLSSISVDGSMEIVKRFVNNETAFLTGDHSTIYMISQAPKEVAELCSTFLNRNSI